ncbi:MULTISPECIES: SDR family NAD(P)-dependent oxidoreductase [Bacillus cereus group]|uniref:A0A024BAQ6 (Beta-ketoacyl synthase) n=1 Tax=Bacillus thuringiensis TaxID=1428 RepID=A0A1C3ZZA0_BACTU|nr:MULTISPECIES: SDR family NAD(P)-dependent oxidoreductase [Bacillus cereus group]MED3024749.1 SDR family NAD(P)-dependent oxidoreductase [Bacillus wiedmannii]OUB62076.1 hypothetical protein BK743_06950 [Bacillus thuringiensis serovar sylvestriensis]SCB87616.1 A0A024BAQ6 (Beta-ketoacyl synthase) [Bacillus thuringiensis]
MNKTDMKQVLQKIKKGEISAEEAFSLFQDFNDTENANESQSREPSTLLYYENEWRPGETMDGTEPFDRELLEGHYLVFDKDQIMFHQMQQLITETGKKQSRFVLVMPGQQFRKIGNEIYELDPMNEEGYSLLMDDLGKTGHIPDKIIHMWSNEPFTTGKNQLGRQLSEGGLSTLFITKALKQQANSKKGTFIYAYQGQIENPQYAAVKGLINVLALENPMYVYRSIDLQESYSYGETGSSMARRLLSELQNQKKEERHIRYIDNQRAVLRLKSFNPNEESLGNLPLNKNGVYLITGGTGKLGGIVSRYLAGRGTPKLVLVGSNDINGSKEEEIQKLKALGAEVDYVKADISDREDMEKLYRELKSKHQKVNGIFHLAGVIRDSLILNKKTQDLKDVLAPKIEGTVLLDEIFGEEELDCFVMFSSISAVIGTVGQADYAFGNSFMDHYALRREELRRIGKRHGQTISINWPLWKEGGMGVDSQTEEMINKTTGFTPLETISGIRALEQGLRLKKNGFMLLNGDKSCIEEFINSQKSEHKKPNKTKTSAKKRLLLKKLHDDLIRYVCDILKTTEDDFDIEVEMSRYGFESITLTEFSNKINGEYGLQIMPSIFFEHTSMKSFMNFLCTEYEDKLNTYYRIGDEHAELMKVQADQTTGGPGASNSDKHVINKEKQFISKKESSAIRKEPIAIIGLGGVMPGSETLDEFWDSIANEESLITEVPPSRWDWQSYYGEPQSEANRTNVKWGGFMKEIDKFDARFFGISPKEAEIMNPQQRIFMETVWQTIENAGYNTSHLSGSSTGLFVGVAGTDYNDSLINHKIDIDAYTSTGLAHSMVANRISYLLDINGPSEAIDTACSSSLVAIHRAVQAIHNGECEAAIAGGVNVMIHPTLHIAFSKAGMLSEDGKCKSFDKDANGYVRGEGAGAVYLKPLSRALADGDYIHGLIKGSAVNHGGKANSLTAPNPTAQAELLIRAYDDAEIDPRSISYIEAHGTGTSLGDPVEINGLKKAFVTQYKKWGYPPPIEPHCGIGSVKTNIGHLETAAGIAGVLKVLFAMKHKKLPAILNFNESNPYIQLEGSPFYLVEKTVDWNNGPNGMPRIAGISSFGFGGANAHIIIEEYSSEKLEEPEEVSQQVVVLSAKNGERLKVYAENLKDYLLQNQNINLRNLAYTLQNGRKAHEERLACVVSDVKELIDKLNEFIKDKTVGGLTFYGNIKKIRKNVYSFLDDDKKEYIKRFILNKQFNKIAEFWIAGYEIEWKILHEGKSVKRLPLPTYPFARESHWFESKRREADKPLIIAKKDEHPVKDGFKHEIKESASPFFLKQEWQTRNKVVEDQTSDEPDSLIVLVQDDQTFYDFKSEVETRSPNNKVVVRLKWGFAFADLGDDTYELNPSGEADYRLLQEALQLKGIDVSTIVHLWSMNDGLSTVLEKTLKLGVHSVFNGIRMLLDQNSNVKKKFIFAVTGIPENILPQYSAVASMLRTINLENHNFIARYLMVDDKKLLPRLILSELNGLEGFEEVCYLNGQRSVLMFQEKEYAPEPEPNMMGNPKPQGVYIVTGGTGGLGRVFSMHLADKYKARLVLVGRSIIDSTKQQFIKELKNLGGQAVYIQADVSDKEDVRRLVEETKSTFGSINGIFHCAGVTKDSFFIHKTQQELKEVMAPKIQGTLYLDEATRNEQLDLFVLFSSLTAIIGNVGQSDYAYANGFLNHYARHRNHLVKNGKRYGRTLSIGWPLWSEGGMRISDMDRKILQDEIGIVEMPTDEGIKAWNIALNTDTEELSFIYGKGFAMNRLVKQKAEGSQTVPKESLLASGTLKQSTGEFIKEIFAQLLKIPVNQLEEDTPFDEYGIDSIAIKQFNFDIEQKIGKMPKTLLFEVRTIKELVSYMVEHHESQLMDCLGMNGDEKSKEGLMESITPDESESSIDMPPQKENSREVQRNPLHQKEDIFNDINDIAIIGLAGKYPGAKNLSEFWRNMVEGKHSITEIPLERWDYKQYYNPDPDKSKEGKMYTKWGGFLQDVDKFDTRFFGISPREAELMDPQERMFLETAWEVLEDAGYTRNQLRDLLKRDNSADIGVFIGATTFSYSLLGADEWSKGNLIVPNSEPWSIANRVSYLFNFSGPSVPVDTACSSSLTALHLACESLKKGECRAAIVGGVNLYLHPSKFVGMSQMRMLSPTGRCNSFGEDGDGFVPGEGVGAVLIKPLADAIKDKDNIHAVIKGTSVNHGGKTNGYTVPNPSSHASLITEALTKAQIDPRTISYIEAHGTGTILGDPIEVTGLTKAFHSYTLDKQFCSIGSVKSNIGHLESAAGIAGLTKIILQMKHGQLVPSLNAERLNSNIDFEDSPFYLQQRLEEWKKPEVISKDGRSAVFPRRAGISSFGAGGSNAHVILEEYSSKTKVQEEDGKQHIVVLSAKNSERLLEYAKRLSTFLQQEGQFGMHEIECGQKIHKDILGQVVSQVAATVQVNENEIGTDESLSSYGFDRIKLAELTNLLKTNLGLDVGINDISIHSTVETITNNIRPKKRLLNQSWSKRNSLNVTLEELSFTLQTGREAMDERIAMLVSSKNELMEKLKQFINGDSSIHGLYKSNIKETKWNANLLLEGEAGQVFTTHVIQKGELEKICQLWVMGAEIDWQLFYTKGSPYKVSLPSYPFEKERYWFPKLAEPTVDIKQRNAQSLHPLLDQNVSTLLEQCFNKVLLKEDWFVKDHVVRHEKMLPGAAQLEMAREAGELSGNGSKVNVIKNVVWSRPVTVTGEKQELRVRLYPEGGNAGYEIYSGSKDDKVAHSQGLLFYDAELNSGSDFRLPLQAIKERLKQSRKGTEYYKEFEHTGLSYGPSFQTIEHISFNASEALSKLKLPAHVYGQHEGFTLHPSLLDGAFQSVIGLAENSVQRATFIPFSIGELSILGSVQADCYVYVTISELKSNNDSGNLVFDVKITDTDGFVLVSISEFVVRVLRDIQDSSDKLNHSMYFSGIWKKRPMASLHSHTSTLGNVLIFDTDYEISRYLAKDIGENSVLIVRPGSEFKVDAGGYQINPDRPSDYELLLADLKAKNKVPDSVIHLWSKDPYNGNSLKIKNQLELSIYSLFNFCKAIEQHKSQEEIRIIYAYPSSIKEPEPHYAAVSGFLGTLSLENSRYICKVMELGRNNNTSYRDWATIFISELLERGDRMEVRYEDGKRYVRVFEEFSMETRMVNPNLPNFQEGKAYLLTGGLGGLGLIFARYMANKAKVKLALTDLNGLNDAKIEKIKELEDLGVQVIYRQCDLSNQAETERLVKYVKSKFGRLDGIIHGAGIIRDALFSKKTREEMDFVLNPKVYGTINLDEATKGEALDFFVMFSSLAAFGNLGQCDYSYANNFLVQYTYHRNRLQERGERAGRTLSINWPLWKHGGMKTDKHTERYFESMGMKLLETGTGLMTLEKGLQTDIEQIIVIEGEGQKTRKKIEQLLSIRSSKVEKLKTEKMKLKGAPPIDQLRADLVRIVCEILKIREEHVDIEAEISEYGFDSVSVTEFSNKVNEKYNLSVTPAIFFEHPYIGSYADYLYREFESLFILYYGDTSKGDEPEDETLIIDNELQQSVSNRFSTRKEITQLKNTSKAPSTSEPIAIIGIGGVMPQSEDLRHFWRNLVNEEDLITKVPVDRWDWQKYYGDPVNDENKTNVTRAGFMQKIDEFDALFFNISPREASMMDPVQRIFLETAWKTVEDAGYKASDLSGTNTGLFVGVVSMEYYDLIKDSGVSMDPHMSTGNARSILANRISYLLNLRGPSETIDTACSSSLVAIHRAVENIRMGKCEMALVGGVNVILSPTVHIAYSKAGMLSPDGRSKTFDKNANGYGRGEGSGAILLKPLSKAQADGDHIYGLIKGTAENHGGHVNTLTAPNPNAQAEVIVAAYDDADIDPSTIGFIEAHGTGTSLGDPIEVNGLKKAFKELYDKHGKPMPEDPICGIGSVKTNIGHLEAAAGIAGILKIVLAMKNKVLPANRNFVEINPYVEIESSPFYFVNETKKWESLQDDKGNLVPRRASVSSFGFGGVNAHVVLEEYENPTFKLKNGLQPQVFIFSAKTEERLKEYASVWTKFLKNCQQPEEVIGCEGLFLPNLSAAFEDIAINLQKGRTEMDERLAIVAESPSELIQLLDKYKSGEKMKKIFTGNAKRDKQASELKVNEIEQPNLEGLAALWVTGANVNWKSLHGDRIHRRLSLPTYPFSRDRHWIKTTESHGVKQACNEQGVVLSETTIPELPRHRTGLMETLESLQPFMKKDEAFHAFQMAASKLEEQLNVILLKVFVDMGAFVTVGEKYTIEGLKSKLGIISRYGRLYNALLGILKKAGYVTIQGNHVVSTERVQQDSSAKKIMETHETLERMIVDYPEIQFHVKLVKECMNNLIDILRGRKSATETMFPHSSMELVEKMYKDNASSDYYNHLVASVIELYIHRVLENDPDAQIKILEIGAGTGGTSKAVLERIEKYTKNIRFIYTDISKSFLLYGKRHYGSLYSFMEFQQLNIENDLEEQGYNPQEFDIVIASNVLHATRRLNKTLSNSKKLLKPGGWLLLNEVTVTQPFLTLTFGLLEGWWFYEDEQERLEGAPLLSSEMWESQLIRNGFEYAVGCCLAMPENSLIQQDVIVGQNVSSTDFRISGIGMAANDARLEEVASPLMKGKQIEKRIIECLGDILQLELHLIDPDIPYTDYGVDSLLAVECVNIINGSLGIHLRTTDLFNFATVRNLAKHIEEKFKPHLDEKAGIMDRDDHVILDILKAVEEGKLDIEQAKRIMEVSHDY